MQEFRVRDFSSSGAVVPKSLSLTHDLKISILFMNERELEQKPFILRNVLSETPYIACKNQRLEEAIVSKVPNTLTMTYFSCIFQLGLAICFVVHKNITKSSSVKTVQH